MRIVSIIMILMLGAVAFASLPAASAQSGGSCNQGITAFGNRVNCESDNCEVVTSGGAGFICYGPVWCDDVGCYRPVCISQYVEPCLNEPPQPGSPDCVLNLGNGFVCFGDEWCDSQSGACGIPMCLTGSGNICINEDPYDQYQSCSMVIIFVTGFFCDDPTRPDWVCLTYYRFVCLPITAT